MQHDQSKLTGVRKLDRTRIARTPDRTEVRNLNSSMINLNMTKKNMPNTRLTMVPPSLKTSTNNLRKLELENNNLELELAYSEYVSSCAELILEKKKFKETEEVFSKSIMSLYEETKKLQEKCKIFETKLNDIKYLTHMNRCTDTILDDTKIFNNNLKKYETRNVLSQLEKLLNRFNVLRCKNVVLPKDPEEMQQFKEILKDCCTILDSINDPVENNVLNTVALKYEEFLLMYNEIAHLKKIIKEKICNLQIDVLKTCSYTLLENDDQLH